MDPPRATPGYASKSSSGEQGRARTRLIDGVLPGVEIRLILHRIAVARRDVRRHALDEPLGLDRPGRGEVAAGDLSLQHVHVLVIERDRVAAVRQQADATDPGDAAGLRWPPAHVEFRAAQGSERSCRRFEVLLQQHRIWTLQRGHAPPPCSRRTSASARAAPRRPPRPHRRWSAAPPARPTIGSILPPA